MPIMILILLVVSLVVGAGVWLTRVRDPVTYPDKAMVVKTSEPTNVTNISVTLNGNLTFLRNHKDANVSFMWREYHPDETDKWNRTNNETVKDTGSFYTNLTTLTKNTTYEYKAVAMNDTGGTTYRYEGNITRFVTLNLETTTVQGDGSKNNPYCIGNVTQLQAVQNNLSSYYELCSDIDASETKNWNNGHGFLPIGDIPLKFHGFFDGNHYNITDLYIDRPERNNTGLFGHVGHEVDKKESTIIENITLKRVNITGVRGVGSLIGRVTGNENTLIKNCSVNGGNVTGEGATGGLVGAHKSYRETQGGVDNPVINMSYADVNVTNVNTGGDKFGGLVGCSQKGTIENSYALGNVTAEGAERVGGLAGCIGYRGEIYHCYSTGNVSADGGTKIGGLVGSVEGGGVNVGKVFNSYWNNKTSNRSTSAGGKGRNTTDMTGDPYGELTYNEWNFTTIWEKHTTKVEDREGNTGYPALSWQ